MLCLKLDQKFFGCSGTLIKERKIRDRNVKESPLFSNQLRSFNQRQTGRVLLVHV